MSTSSLSPTAVPSAGGPANEHVLPWQNSADLACVRDAGGGILAVNPAFARKFGLTTERLIGTAVGELIHPDDVADWNEAFREISRPPHRCRSEQRWHTAQGWRWIEWESAALFDAERHPFAIRSVGRDVTKRRMAEEQSFRLARATEQSPISVVITDPTGRVQYVNPKFTSVTGFTLEDILDRNVDVLRAGHPTDESYGAFWQTVHDGREWRGELRTTTKDGRVIWESVQVSLLRGPTGEVINLLSLREDITGRRSLEEQLRQSQKMESLGTLAGGIAHDFNNLLAIVQGYAEAGLMRETGDERLRNFLREIHTAARRATGLVRQILTFSRKTEIQSGPVDLNTIVRELGQLISQTFPRTISINFEVDPALPSLRGDANQLHQVVLNLCVNARDAMPEGGTLTLSTRVVPRSGVPAALGRHEENWVCLRISDSGVGMAPEVRERIFEPFFTTRPGTGGTGLGLAVVYGVVQSHQGYIEVESAPGQGSAFFVYLPLTEGDKTKVRVAAGPGPMMGGREAVLVVDDEPSLRLLMASVLQQAGYRVSLAADGLEATEYLSKPSNLADIVLMDLNMPRRNGLETFKAVRGLRPDLKFIFLTGNLTPETQGELAALGQFNIMTKPSGLPEISLRLRQVLDEK